MKNLLTLLLLARFAVGVGLAQESPIVGPPACRFLFYVESARDMARISSATAATVAHLVATGVSGRMQPGDAFAVWHYNAEPQQFEFPIKLWTTEKSASLAGEVGAFVRKLRYDQPAQSGLALREMYFALAATEALTVLLVNNGDTPLVGTPFDLAINKTYLERADDARARRQPIVTALRCVNKKIVSWAVTVGREEIVLPDAPLATLRARTNAAAPKLLPTTATIPPRVAGLSAVVPPAAPPTPVLPASAFPAVATVPTAVRIVAVPASPVTVPATAPRVLPRSPIRDIFAIPFSSPPVSTTNTSDAPEEIPPRPSSPTNVFKILPARISAATNAATAASFPAAFGERPRRMHTLQILGAGSPAFTNAETAALLPSVAPPTAVPGMQLPTGELPVTNFPAIAGTPARSVPSAAAVAPTPTPAPAATNGSRAAPAGFARKVAPTFALDGPNARGTVAPPPADHVRSAVPVVVEIVAAPLPRGAAPPRPAAVVATNLFATPLATGPAMIDPNPRVKPVQFLVAGLVTLAVAVWFIILILRGGRSRSRSSISRAVDR